MIAAIPPSPSLTASCINLALKETKVKASSKSKDSAATYAEYSPRECPAISSTSDGLILVVFQIA